MLRLLSLPLLCIIIMVIAASALSSRSAVSSPAPATDAAKAAARAINDETVLSRDASGKFHLEAIVNGENTQFLIDTGADIVALSVEDAQLMGVEVDRDSFGPIAETASGTGNGARITIGSIEIAGQEFTDVEAIVIDGLRENLLGQSLLRKLGSVEMQADKMIIRRS